MRRICQIQFIHLFTIYIPTCRINVDCRMYMCTFMIGHTTRYAIFNFYHSAPERITIKTKKLFEFNFHSQKSNINRMFCLFGIFVIAYQSNFYWYSFFYSFDSARLGPACRNVEWHSNILLDWLVPCTEDTILLITGAKHLWIFRVNMFISFHFPIWVDGGKKAEKEEEKKTYRTCVRSIVNVITYHHYTNVSYEIHTFERTSVYIHSVKEYIIIIFYYLDLREMVSCRS